MANHDFNWLHLGYAAFGVRWNIILTNESYSSMEDEGLSEISLLIPFANSYE